MSGPPAVRIVDTTLRDGSHAIAHQFGVDHVKTIAGALDQAGVWAIAVGHGDGLGASSIQYGRPRHSDEELLKAAASVARSAQIAIAILPGVGTKDDLERARDAGATVARVSTVVTEADIGVQHHRLARDLGMVAHTHLNTAHLLDAAGLVEQCRIVADAGSEGIFIVDSAGALLTDDVRRRVAAMRAALPDNVAVGMHEHNNLSLAVANSVAAIEEGATLIDASLAGLGAGGGNCQTEALVAVLEKMGIATGIDLWSLQDVADEVVRLPLGFAIERALLHGIPGGALRQVMGTLNATWHLNLQELGRPDDEKLRSASVKALKGKSGLHAEYVELLPLTAPPPVIVAMLAAIADLASGTRKGPLTLEE